jgi:SAM-dependent methyltransferase
MVWYHRKLHACMLSNISWCESIRTNRRPWAQQGFVVLLKLFLYEFPEILRTAKCSCVLTGCGNSLLPIKMYEDGFHDIVNVDYSPVVIEKMRNKWKHLTGMEWTVADIKELTTYFSPFSFDVVIEKGTIDAMLVGEKDPWKISMIGEQSIDIVLRQVLLS